MYLKADFSVPGETHELDPVGHRAAVRRLRALIARQYAALVASAAVEA